MPSMPGMRTSISTTSGRRRAADAHRLVAVGRRADDGEVRLGVEQRGEAVAHDLLVVGDDDPHGVGSRVHAAPRRSAGRVASTRKPPPGAPGRCAAAAHRCGPLPHARCSPWPPGAPSAAGPGPLSRMRSRSASVGVVQLDVDRGAAVRAGGRWSAPPGRSGRRPARRRVEPDRRAADDQPGAGRRCRPVPRRAGR